MDFIGAVISGVLQSGYVWVMLAVTVSGVWTMRGRRIQRFAKDLDGHVVVNKPAKKVVRGVDDDGRAWELSMVPNPQSGLAGSVQIWLKKPSPGLLIQKEGMFKRRNDVRLGADWFDGAVVLEGRREVLFAVLSARNQSKVKDAVEKRGMTLEDGVLTLKGLSKLKYLEARTLMDRAQELANILETPDDEVIVERLARIARSKDDDPVRLRAAGALLNAFPEDPEAARIADEFLEDGRAGLVGPALVRFGVDTGRIDPRQLMSLITHRDLRVRTEAARALGESGDLAAVEPLLALGSSEAKDAVQAIQARLGGQRGGLAVMEERAEAGQLSVADRAAGALSIAAKRKA